VIIAEGRRESQYPFMHLQVVTDDVVSCQVPPSGWDYEDVPVERRPADRRLVITADETSAD
jgi:hypothetical protein